MDPGVDGHRPHLGLDEIEENGQFRGGAGEVFGGQGKQGRDPDVKLLQPIQHLFQFVGADPMPSQRVLKSALPGIPPIPV